MFRFCTLKEHYAQQHNNLVEKTNKKRLHKLLCDIVWMIESDCSL